MGNIKLIFIAILIAMSVFSVIFCFFRGKGASHKQLVRFASLLGAMAMLCFGGEVILSHLGMGWRCTPFNIMLLLCSVLLIATLWNCMHVFTTLENANQALVGFGLISLVVVMIMTLLFVVIYFFLLSWHDSLSIYDGQMIVCARDTHGGSGSWRYYTHINNLIHGVEITHDGWGGTR